MRTTIDYGIDLGTTNSAIARREGETTRLLPGKDGSVLLPSAVHHGKEGQVLIGASARERYDADPANTALEFKRLMGTDEKKVFPSSSKALSPEELSAQVLGALAERIGEEGPLRAAVITVPAMFQLPQCEATRRAANLAGIDHVVLLQEPIAAAIAHSGTASVKEGYWLVYDLGGGTFDISLVRSRGGRLQVIDHDGDNHLGGRDFDRVLARHAAERIREQGLLGDFKRSDPRHEDAFARLKVESERLRVQLSTQEEGTFQVDGLATDANGKPVGVRFELSRTAFEAMAAPLLQRTIQLCRKLLGRSDVKQGQLNGVVMVGGPTLMPCVPRLLQEALGIEARHVMDPLTIVASGAALFASTQKLPAEFRSSQKGSTPALDLQLEYEPMTTDPAPTLVVRAAPAQVSERATVRVHREGGGYDSGALPFGSKRTLLFSLGVHPKKLNRFQVTVLDPSGNQIPVAPSEFTLLHGMSVARPPLSQSVGIMLAGNEVCWYVRKGTSLPARNRMTHATTIALARGQSGEAVHVPMVQGESDRADRNKAIGILRIHADNISRDLPAGSEVEVHLTLDESASTSARAYVPLLDQWFDDVVMFRMEAKASEQVSQGLADQKDRLANLEALAEELERDGGGDLDERVSEIEDLLDEGDRDSVDLADQLVRRMTQDLDQVETTNRGQSLAEEFQQLLAAINAMGRKHGDASDSRQLEALSSEFKQAIARGDLDQAEARRQAAVDLYQRISSRQPEFWEQLFDHLISRVKELGKADRARSTIERGLALKGSSNMALRDCCRELIALLPNDARPPQAAGLDFVSHLK
jgi:molecular chaperone DnaK